MMDVEFRCLWVVGSLEERMCNVCYVLNVFYEFVVKVWFNLYFNMYG